MKYTIKGSEKLRPQFLELAIQAGMALGAPREDALAAWIDYLIAFGHKFHKPWLKLSPSGFVIDSLNVASAEACAHLQKQTEKNQAGDTPPPSLPPHIP